MWQFVPFIPETFGVGVVADILGAGVVVAGAKLIMELNTEEGIEEIMLHEASEEGWVP